MELLRGLLAYVGAGGLLGLAAWWLASALDLHGSVWVGVGAAAAIGVYFLQRIERRRGRRSVNRAAAPSAEAGAGGAYAPSDEARDEGSQDGDVRALRARFGAYGLASFVAVGLLIPRRRRYSVRAPRRDVQNYTAASQTCA